jgi:hypothetical protein
VLYVLVSLSVTLIAYLFVLQLRFLFRGGAFTLLAFGYLGYRFFSTTSFEELAVNSEAHRALSGDDSCTPAADPPALAIAYVIGVLYMFVGLAIVAGE